MCNRRLSGGRRDRLPAAAMSAFIKGGGGKPDIAAMVKVDDLEWPFPAGGLDGLYGELARR